MQTIGERIKRVRISKHMTRKILGEKLELNHPEIRISAYENDKVYPRNKMIDKMAKALNVSRDWLITGTFDRETLNGLKDTDFFDDRDELEIPKYYFQLVELINQNKGLLSSSLTCEDISEIAKLIYKKIYEKRGTLKEVQGFTSFDEYMEYQEKQFENKQYYEERQEEQLEELLSNGEILLDENGDLIFPSEDEE